MIELIGEAFSADETYVALEVQSDGDGNFIPRDGGLAFELEYIEDLSGTDTPAFRLPLLVSQMQTFGICRVVDTGGLSFSGQTNSHVNETVTQTEVEFMIDPEHIR